MKNQPRSDRTEPKFTAPKSSRHTEPVLSTKDNLIALLVALTVVGVVSFVVSKILWHFL